MTQISDLLYMNTANLRPVALCVTIMLLLQVKLCASAHDIYRYPQPEWDIGDKWIACFELFGRPWQLTMGEEGQNIPPPGVLAERELVITVEERDTLKGIPCWVLVYQYGIKSRTSIAKEWSGFRLWVVIDDGSTKKAEPHAETLTKYIYPSKLGNQSTMLYTYYRTHTPILIFPWRLCGGILRDSWMVFLESDTAMGDKNAFRSGEWFSYKKEDSLFVLTWLRLFRYQEKEDVRIEQKWNSNINFWNTYSVYDDGHLWQKCTVVSYNGVKVELH